MTHLQETEFIDALEGTLPPARAAHLAACDACRAQADVLRTSLASVVSTEATDPSPLFWDHFATRVNERIDEAPERRGWLGIPRLAFVALGTLAVLVVGFNLLTAPGGTNVPAAPTAPIATMTDAAPEIDDLDADADWAIVRAAADGLDVEDAQAEGLIAKPGTADRMAMDLTESERAELMRLIQSEIKTGA
jgi:hypothetical protein